MNDNVSNRASLIDLTTGEPILSFGSKGSLSWRLELHTYSQLMLALSALGALNEEHRQGRSTGAFLCVIYIIGKDRAARPDAWYHLN